MYSVYIDDILLPVTPEKITWSYKGKMTQLILLTWKK